MSLIVSHNHILIRETPERAIKYSEYTSNEYTNKICSYKIRAVFHYRFFRIKSSY